MHSYWKPGDNHNPINWHFWPVFGVVCFITMAYITMMFAEADAIAIGSVAPRVMKAKTVSIRSTRYYEQAYILDDGTPCKILNGGSHSGVIGITCNWNWRL